jgi:hypothetical protein
MSSAQIQCLDNGDSYDDVILEIDSDSGKLVGKANQCKDYVYHGNDLKDLCVWDL